MIYGILYQSSGLGNQLHRMVATRVKALELGVDYKMVYIGNDSSKDDGFKGKSFMKSPEIIQEEELSYVYKFLEKKVVEDGVDIRSYDPEFNFIQDGTLIEGEFQDERYWEKYEKEVNEWLDVKPLGEQKGWIRNGDYSTVWFDKTDDEICTPYLEMPDDLCVIGFRGGEFKVFPELFLPKEYWDEGIIRMLKLNPKMRFEVHTDDEKTAKEFFPDYNVIHDIGINWRSMRYAKYAIIANSSFFILPRWLNNGVTIAPKGWARHNWKDGGWYLPQNYYSRFSYI